jgi:hypothetical protein
MNLENNSQGIADVSEDSMASPVKKPHHIPVNICIQEGKNLYYWAREDNEALVAAGLDPGLIDDLPHRCEALSEAEALYFVEKNTRKEAIKKWTGMVPQAYDLKKRLIINFTYAFRNHPKLLMKVQTLKKAKRQVPMIQCLQDLCVLGRGQQELLSAIGFDMSLLERAAQTSLELKEIHAEANTARFECSSAKKNRDRAYTLLKAAVDEIRTCGRFVFRGNKERAKGYSSNYLKMQNAKNAHKGKKAAADAAANADAAESQENT